ncbi:hypothetical protein BDE36_3547 [Arcticibacter tournemirensis]|uniref:hypothetical protein n=1 Tax=Arcticibacter tournemirensis TaxID=699437 RepID=UPI00114FEE76|nr:hypothetical protein [Arcticibacter tournemirensis]TQM51268.1 hypothetical protein BDE36_3044 [Arcticibacter tournemirensis]TQM51763.1 hypothetical protein BDE36_3547 [Arcticibacter tournemirensis]
MKKKRKLPRFKDLTPEEYQKVMEGLKGEIDYLKNENEQLQNELSDLSARKAFLNEIDEQNERLLRGKNLL